MYRLKWSLGLLWTGYSYHLQNKNRPTVVVGKVAGDGNTIEFFHGIRLRRYLDLYQLILRWGITDFYMPLQNNTTLS